MSIKELASLIGQTITLYDRRTNAAYQARINDVRSTFGKTQLQVDHVGNKATWFEPTASELATVSDPKGKPE